MLWSYGHPARRPRRCARSYKNSLGEPLGSLEYHESLKAFCGNIFWGTSSVVSATGFSF